MIRRSGIRSSLWWGERRNEAGRLRLPRTPPEGLPLPGRFASVPKKLPNRKRDLRPSAGRGPSGRARHAGRPAERPRASSASATATGGKTSQFTASHPAEFRSEPDENEAAATEPKTRKSFAA